MSRLSQVGRVATSIVTEGGVTSVYYHGTPVVRWRQGGESVTLDTGGYFTVTTKRRMNQASNQYGLGFVVYQRSKRWFVDYNGRTERFDGNTLTL